ncbi:MFS transporter [Bartonella sp. B10]
MKNRNWSELLLGKNAILSLTLTSGVALYAITSYIVVTILPSLLQDIGGGVYYSWVTSVFVTASLLGTSLATKILEKLGPRKAYVIACLIFIIGTFVCSTVSTMPSFLIGRFIQGFGGGSLLSLSYSMVRIVFIPTLWSYALGIIAGMWGISILLGPAIGGICIRYGMWRASFWIIGSLAIIFTIVAFVVLPIKNKNHIPTSPLPLPQLLILILLIFIISTGEAIDTVVAQICGLVIGFSLLFVLAKIESSTLHPMLPYKAFFFSSEFFPVYTLMLIMTVVAFSIEFYFPLFLQTLHGQEPLVAGYMAALISLGWTCGSLLSAGASIKQVCNIIVYSPILNLFGVGILLWLVPKEVSALEYTIIICIVLFATGISAGMAWPHLLTRILQCADDKDALRASESLTSIQLFSAALSATLAGTITNLAGRLDPGGVEGMISSAKALLVTLIAILFCLGIPFALRVSYRIFKNPAGQSNK